MPQTIINPFVSPEQQQHAAEMQPPAEFYTGHGGSQGGSGYARLPQNPQARRLLRQFQFREFVQNYEDQKKQRRAKREASALIEQYRGGGITENTFNNAAQQIIQKVGWDSPAVDQLTGLFTERQRENEKRKQETAKKFGIDSDLLMIDERTNGVALNTQKANIAVFQDERKKSADTIKYNQETNQLKNRKILLDNLTQQEKYLSDQAEIAETNKNNAALQNIGQELHRVRDERWRILGKEPTQYSNTPTIQPRTKDGVPYFDTPEQLSAAYDANPFNGNAFIGKDRVIIHDGHVDKAD